MKTGEVGENKTQLTTQSYINNTKSRNATRVGKSSRQSWAVSKSLFSNTAWYRSRKLTKRRIQYSDWNATNGGKRSRDCYPHSIASQMFRTGRNQQQSRASWKDFSPNSTYKNLQPKSTTGILPSSLPRVNRGRMSAVYHASQSGHSCELYAAAPEWDEVNK